MLAGNGLQGYSGDGGAATNASLNLPQGVAFDSKGNLYIADTFNNRIRKVTPDGVFTTLAGQPGTFGSTDGIGSEARFSYPQSLALDVAGNVYVADFYFNTIRKGYPVPMILDAGLKLGQFGFNLTGPAGRTVVVEASADLVNWLPIWTNNLTPNLIFVDGRGVLPSKRFYRARLP